MSQMTIGKYSHYNSFIHKMDPRNKIVCLILLMVAIFISFPTYEVTFIVSGVLFVFILSLMFISHVSFRDLFSSLKAMWFFVILLLAINIFIKPSGATMQIGTSIIYWESIFQTIKILIRLILMVCLTMILTSTTKPLDLTYALEWFLSPLKIIKFPAHEVAMTISIALRFIPTLLDETQRLIKAQESRGVDFKHGKLVNRFKAIISLIVPLFVSAFQKSEDLANAMEARGYDPRAKRTKYHIYRFHIKDLFSFILCGIVMSGIIVISHFGWSINTPLFLAWFFIGVSILFVYIITMGICYTNIKK